MIDIHCHLLYGVDDGAKTWQESLELLQEAKAQGVEKIICTPHYREGMFVYRQESMKARFHRLKEIGDRLGIELFPGMECYGDDRLLVYLQQGRCITLAGSDYVLVEYSHDITKEELWRSCGNLTAHGYIPVVAHVERYHRVCKDTEFLKKLRELGGRIQINAGSVIGQHGWSCKGICRALLKEGVADIVASDTHGVKHRRNHMKQCRTYLAGKYGEMYAGDLMERIPQEILENR
ncbi:tyrosine-protein phosphatase [Suipraeoptans intestinalis]|uniref:protein-tyrosine-phosphatase n=1 Tax=Suipraeoptans intestinalis TaxID=2606628 RepID=A0A6N7V1C6_9FIRM|nr:CpsB/CapC family capsule biosynthesis tyrosine phosphatase [Suipraeoptans intestinalis]MDD7770609.1 capsular biosynthesis protein [Suipraeoptans intestinalis]MSR93967.1 capsular biosynthesis protein [Suipraeoptans intestinalis]